MWLCSSELLFTKTHRGLDLAHWPVFGYLCSRAILAVSSFIWSIRFPHRQSRGEEKNWNTGQQRACAPTKCTEPNPSAAGPSDRVNHREGRGAGCYQSMGNSAFLWALILGVNDWPLQRPHVAHIFSPVLDFSLPQEKFQGNDQPNTEKVPHVSFQRKTFLFLLNISVPWTIVHKKMFAKQTRDPTLNMHLKKKCKEKRLSSELFAQFQFGENGFFLKWDSPLFWLDGTVVLCFISEKNGSPGG